MVTETIEPSNTTKPYIIRAIYEWCVDSQFTPYLKVSVCPNTRVPRDYVQGGIVILNIATTATHKLNLTNDDISFTGRFAGSAMEIWVPVKNVLAIFAKETGQGVTFDHNYPSSHKNHRSNSSLMESSEATKDRFSLVDSKHTARPGSESKKTKGTNGKPSTFLKRIK